MATLQAQPWRTGVVGSRPCLLNGTFGDEEDAGYEVMLWDEGVMWVERLVRAEVTERMATLNPNLEAPSTLILSHLSSLLQSPITAFSEATSATGRSRTLVISGTMSGLPFTWQFQCSRAPDVTVQSHLVEPLLCCVSELCRQRQLLVDTIKRKDREIQDYRDGGAVLSRRHLETASFEEKAFTSAMATSQEFEECVRNSQEILANDNFRSLYHSVGMVAVRLKEADDPPELPNTDISPSHSPSPPTSPPAKRAAPAENEELGRREALEKKLDQERVRGRKKKKRLM